MKHKKDLSIYENMPVGKAVISNAIPAMLSMIMVLIYNLADTLFIGMTHNDIMVAAVSLASPVFMIFMGVASIFGMGGTSAISRAFGAGKKERVKNISSFCFWSMIVVGIVGAIIFFIFINPLLTTIGASANTWEYAKQYLLIVAISIPFTLIQSAFANLVRAEGQPNLSLIGAIIGNLTNIILDPILILGFNMGIVGAAIATVIGDMAGAIYYIVHICGNNSQLSANPKHFKISDGICKDVLSVGIPAALGSLFISIAQIIANKMMTQYGDMAVAGIGVSKKITMIINTFIMALGMGIQPLFGYSIGKKDYSRYKELMTFSLKFSVILSVTMTVICYLFNKPLVKIFLTADKAVEYGLQFNRVSLISFFLLGTFYCFVNGVQAMGNAKASLIVNVSRQGIIYIPVIIILHLAIGMNGIIWAQVVSDFAGIILAYIVWRRNFTILYKMNDGD